MNWKKLLLFVLGSAVVGGVSPWLSGQASGTHVAFTAGNVILPALATLGATLTALFTVPPHQG